MVSPVRQAFRSEMAGSIWDAYRRRVQKLIATESNPLLARYRDLLTVQAEISSALIKNYEVADVASSLSLLSYFDDGALRPLLEKARRGAAAAGLTIAENESIAGLENLWRQVDEFEYPGDFPARLVLEVFATEVSAWPHREIETSPDRCPHCGFPILCSILHEEGMGRHRSGCCSLCASEWSLPRLGCLRCGEQRPEKLPLFTFEGWPHIRVEACDSCGGWLKSIDLTSDSEALPAPDDVWSSAMNIWASERRYQPVGNNLFGL